MVSFKLSPLARALYQNSQNSAPLGSPGSDGMPVKVAVPDSEMKSSEPEPVANGLDADGPIDQAIEKVWCDEESSCFCVDRLMTVFHVPFWLTRLGHGVPVKAVIQDREMKPSEPEAVANGLDAGGPIDQAIEKVYTLQTSRYS